MLISLVGVDPMHPVASAARQRSSVRMPQRRGRIRSRLLVLDEFGELSFGREAIRFTSSQRRESIPAPNVELAPTAGALIQIKHRPLSFPTELPKMREKSGNAFPLRGIAGAARDA